MVKNLIGAFLLAGIAGVVFAQQIGGAPPRRGNPTPGVEQPPPPKIEDRITVSGCLTRIGQPATDPNSFSDSRFVVTNAKRVHKGITGAGTSPVAAAATANRFRLAGVDT